MPSIAYEDANYILPVIHGIADRLTQDQSSEAGGQFYANILDQAIRHIAYDNLDPFITMLRTVAYEYVAQTESEYERIDRIINELRERMIMR